MKAETGWNPSVYNIRYIKPLDTDMMKEISASCKSVITVEDGSVIGGLHGAVAEYMAGMQSPLPIRAIAIPDTYLSQGTQNELREECSLTTDGIYAAIEDEMKKISKKV